MKRIGRILLGLLVALICAAALIAASWYFGGTTERSRFQSPDGRHLLVVYRHPMLFTMPGQGSDAPGTVVLQDANGRELNRTPISMVQLISDPRWREDAVSMKLLFDWKLPQYREAASAGQ